MNALDALFDFQRALESRRQLVRRPKNKETNMAKSAVATIGPARPETTEADLDQLLHPSRFYNRPSDVAEMSY